MSLSNKPESQWSESQLTLELTMWFRKEYPETPYRIDIGADMPLPRVHAGRLKVLHGKWSKGHPDMFIYSGRGKYGALCIEIKTLNAGVPNTEHIRTQKAYHQELRKQGFLVWFGVGLVDCQMKIQDYMNMKLNKRGREHE